MSKIVIRERALQLRQAGQSYSQIKTELGVSKSTLSLWLRQHPLNREQLRVLRDFSAIRIEKFRKTMQAKKDFRLNGYYQESKKQLLPFSERELFIAGLLLYWGEGSKGSSSTVSVSNSDPKLIKFMISWLTSSLKIKKLQIKARLHLYKDMNQTSEIKYWSKQLNLPRKNFKKSYIKDSNRIGLTYKSFGHGTCNVYICDTRLKEKVLMGIKAIADHYTNIPLVGIL